MATSFSIGDFSRATHLTVKTLRHYHEAGLLIPASVDPHSGYRRYTAEQISLAQIIRRFRSLNMPVGEIHAVLATSDLEVRNELIATHLRRLEAELSRTQGAVASLRDILEHSTKIAGSTVVASNQRLPQPSARRCARRTPCHGSWAQWPNCMPPSRLRNSRRPGYPAAYLPIHCSHRGVARQSCSFHARERSALRSVSPVA